MTDAFDRLKSALADRYTIERELGSGGMATVYLAEDLKLHRKVALKVLRPELASVLGPDRFLQEIDIAAKLNHPHILGLFDCGEVGGFLYYVMPYVEGQSLRDKLAKEGELPVAEAVRILRDVVEALRHAHKHNVVHRDIKPDNVMLSEGHALVTDFGVAKAVSDATGAIGLTTEGVALGTPAYMSPEQASADPHIDHRADIYAVGVVAYELLTGRTPFVGNTQQELLAAHVTQTPDPITRYRGEVPPPLEQLVMRCLKKKPADRWQSAEELLPQLEALATPSGGVTPAWTMSVDRRAKHRWMIAGGAAAVIAIIAVIVVIAALPRGNAVRLNPDQVAVAAFRNASGDPSLDQLGERVGHWITQGVQRAAIPVTPWDQALQSWEYVHAESDAGRVRDPVRALAQETGAGIVISGAVYVVEGDSLEIQSNVMDAIRGRLLGTVDPLRGARSSESDLIADIQQRVMGFLAVNFDERLSSQESSVAQPPSFDAYREFDQGLQLYLRSRGSGQDAIPYFHRAFELDTTFLTPLIYASLTHNNIGQWAQSDSLVSVLQNRRSRLSEYDRDWLDYLKATVSGDNAEALRAIRSAARLAPGSKAVYNRAYLAIRWLNGPQEAVDALLTLDPDRGPMRGWRSYFNVLADAYMALGQYERALAVARDLRMRYGDDLRAFEAEAFALVGLGRLEEVSALVEEMLSLPQQGLNQGYYVRRIAVYLRRHGYFEAAMETVNRSIRWYETRSLVAKSTPEWLYPNYAVALFVADRCGDAYESIKPLSEAFPMDQGYLWFKGLTAACRGDREEALEISRSLVKMEMPYQHGEIAGFRSVIAGALGDAETAVMLWRQAVAEGQPEVLTGGDARWIAFERISDYEPWQELIRPKG